MKSKLFLWYEKRHTSCLFGFPSFPCVSVSSSHPRDSAPQSCQCKCVSISCPQPTSPFSGLPTLPLPAWLRCSPARKASPPSFQLNLCSPLAAFHLDVFHSYTDTIRCLLWWRDGVTGDWAAITDVGSCIWWLASANAENTEVVLFPRSPAFVAVRALSST